MSPVLLLQEADALLLNEQPSAAGAASIPCARLYIEGMHGLGRVLVTIGVVIVIAGVCIMLAGKLNLPLGRLPGDIVWRGKNSAFYFPLTTCIVVSVLLSLLFYILSRLRR